MRYFDVILLSDVISSIGPKISDCDTNVLSTILWLTCMKMFERPNKSAEYSIVVNLNKNVRATKHFASSVQFFAAKVDKLLGRPNKKWF